MSVQWIGEQEQDWGGQGFPCSHPNERIQIIWSDCTLASPRTGVMESVFWLAGEDFSQEFTNPKLLQSCTLRDSLPGAEVLIPMFIDIQRGEAVARANSIRGYVIKTRPNSTGPDIAAWVSRSIPLIAGVISNASPAPVLVLKILQFIHLLQDLHLLIIAHLCRLVLKKKGPEFRASYCDQCSRLLIVSIT